MEETKFFAIVFLILLTMGTMLNMFVIIVNGGKMPVYSSDDACKIISNEHFCFDDPSEVNQFKLVDRIQIGRVILSPGDIIIWISGFGAISMLLDIVFKNLKKVKNV